MAWKFVEGLTVADVAFQAQGKTAEKLFCECAEAVTATMVRKVSSVKPVKTKKFSCSAETLEKLLFEFLQHLVFLKDAELLLFSKYEVKIFQPKEKKKTNVTKQEAKPVNDATPAFKLAAVLKGEKLDPKKHELLVDVKAVTWHYFSLIQTPKSFKAQVILDV